MASSVPKAVPSAVNPATSGRQVQIQTRPQRKPYRPATGSPRIPVVPRTQEEGVPDSQPGYGGGHTTGSGPDNGSGAPSVPGMGGALFTSPPIDPHYTSTTQAANPYAKVNNPPTRGMFTRVQQFLNHIATSQDVDNAGWKAQHPQQRTSVMLNTLPPHGGGYAPETFTPRQLPQAANIYKYPPSTGTQPYGTGVLNSDTYGAGQTAGGIGGSNYTASVGPPVTQQVNPPQNTGMPSWG